MKKIFGDDGIEIRYAKIIREFGFTVGEMAVGKLIMEELPIREIASELCVSPKTIKYHLAKMYKKVKVTNQFISDGSGRKRELLAEILRRKDDGPRATPNADTRRHSRDNFYRSLGAGGDGDVNPPSENKPALPRGVQNRPVDEH